MRYVRVYDITWSVGVGEVASVIHALLLVHMMYVCYDCMHAIIKEVVYQDMAPCMCCFGDICEKPQVHFIHAL